MKSRLLYIVIVCCSAYILLSHRYLFVDLLDTRNNGSLFWNQVPLGEAKGEEGIQPACPIIPPGLVGRFKPEIDAPNITHLDALTQRVELGGRYKPMDCTARHRVAIIIPFRDRWVHLQLLLQNLHDFLQRQQLDYGIFIIDQNDCLGPELNDQSVMAPGTAFNRAMLMNIGYVEASKRYDYQCFIFHDVDLVPEDDRNLYTCPESPRHMSVGIDIFNYTPKYNQAFGGVTAVKKDHFILTNGFSNMYFGWGCEDDDFYRRVLDSKLKGVSYYEDIGRYKMLKHVKDTHNDLRASLRKSAEWRRKKEGLNTLKYTVIAHENRSLYTWVYVELKESDIMNNSLLKASKKGQRKKEWNNPIPPRVTWIPAEFTGDLPAHLKTK